MKKLLLISAIGYQLLTISYQATAQTGNGSVGITMAAPAPYEGIKGCPNAMSDKEFNAIKNEIADKNDAEELKEQMAIAKKEAVAHCFLTEQVKTIMKLFRSDENRLEFFKAVYPHIYDQAHYSNVNDAFQDKTYSDKLRVYVNSIE